MRLARDRDSIGIEEKLTLSRGRLKAENDDDDDIF
jgi:hypothetical protein